MTSNHQKEKNNVIITFKVIKKNDKGNSIGMHRFMNVKST